MASREFVLAAIGLYNRSHRARRELSPPASPADMTAERIELPRSPRPGSTWEVTIDELSVDGRGVAHFPAYVGPQREEKDFRFLVRKAVPGDELEVLVERRRGDRIDARIEEVQAESPMRIEPRCRHFGRREVSGEGCGGCTMQSLSYRHQLAAKEKTVKTLVGRAGLDPGRVLPVEGQEEPWYYRNNMEFSFGDTDEREFALGMYPTGYHFEILNLEECYLQSEFVSELLPAARQWARERGLAPYLDSSNEGFLRSITVREGKRTGERLVDLLTTHHETAHREGEEVPARQIAEAFADWVVDWADRRGEPVTSVYWTQKKAIRGETTEWFDHHLYGKPVLEEELHLPGQEVLGFEIDPRAFFQTNTLQAEELYAEVLDRSGLLEEEAEGTVLDLYCGTGTIALCMAPYAERVVGVEMQPDAVANARKNAETNEITNARFFEGDVGEVLGTEDFAEAAPEVDLVVVDPPRAGLQPEALEHVVSVDAPRVVYVSCNPESLSRDLATLTDQAYQLRSIQPVDMFPHTYHIECVALLER
jgi:23S rRNA (uracil1939-C5)-methyltransferase